jgi:hypothetical protein
MLLQYDMQIDFQFIFKILKIIKAIDHLKFQFFIKFIVTLTN